MASWGIPFDLSSAADRHGRPRGVLEIGHMYEYRRYRLITLRYLKCNISY